MADNLNRIAPQPIDGTNGLKLKKRVSKLKKRLIIGFLAVVSLVVITISGLFIWYVVQLSPVDSSNTTLDKVLIKHGSTPAQIAEQLKESGLIRDELAFQVYLRVINKRDLLQAGTYRLSASESVYDIVAHLLSGSTDQFTITFYPGATLVDNTDRAQSKKTDVTTMLRNAGFTDEEISAGLKASYDSPLFATKPLTADLEGYIYGETYKFGVGSTVSEVLSVVFDEFYSVIKENDLVAKFNKRGLTLYKAITLASIIQREVNTESDQRQVAQVFYKRLAEDTVLGSDVTYQYIADKTGVARDVDLDSPYNTRRFAGLPPGPISAPGLSALLAVANPLEGDYLYFLSGDDDITYFAETYAEHESNIVKHCKVKCSTL